MVGHAVQNERRYVSAATSTATTLQPTPASCSDVALSGCVRDPLIQRKCSSSWPCRSSRAWHLAATTARMPCEAAHMHETLLRHTPAKHGAALLARHGPSQRLCHVNGLCLRKISPSPHVDRRAVEVPLASQCSPTCCTTTRALWNCCCCSSKVASLTATPPLSTPSA